MTTTSFSLLPYFSTWVALYPEALPAQIMFGLIFLTSNILYNIATYLVKKANPYNEELQKIDLKSLKRHVPMIIILIGFALSLTVYIYGIYISCLLAIFHACLPQPAGLFWQCLANPE